MGSSTIQGKLWGTAAKDWAELQEPTTKPLWEAMLAAAEVGQGTRLLDAGCGGGGASVLAAARGAQVSGLDAAEALVHIAQERVPGGDFRVGDIEALPFDDETFEAVMAANSLQYAADRLAALRELQRVCVSGGRVVVGLWGAPEKVEYRVIFKAVRDTLPEPPPGDGPFGLSGPGKLEELFEAVGMQVLNSGEASCPFEYRGFERFWQAQLSSGAIQGVLRSVSEEKLKAAVEIAVEPFQANDGTIRIENQFRYVTAGR